MAQAFLIFDFGTNEETAQLARHRIEAWKQGARLNKKLELKFERVEPDAASEAKKDAGTKAASKKSASTKSASTKSDPAAQPVIQMIVRLDFSDHEKLSFQRWIKLIPSEKPFSEHKPRVVRSGDPDFAATAEQFSSVDHLARSDHK